MHATRSWRTVAVTAGALLLVTPAAVAQQWTLRLDLHGRTIEGAPLAWSEKSVLLLGRDGFFWRFSPQEAANFEKTSSTFRSLTVSEMRARLLRELGSAYEISGAGVYLVAHPAGQRDRWAERFDTLYRSFVQYFSVRGFRPRSPQFPLVAIVCPSQGEFLRYARQTESRISSDVLGCYSPTSNRVLLYDVTEGRRDDPNAYVNAETIMHEAAHQAAFNTGVHSRFALPPRWLVEGLGMLFEAPGVWNPRQFPDPLQRIHRGRLQAYRRLPAQQQRGFVADMVADDRVFRAAPSRAYAQAWALSVFLAEQEPGKYARYMEKTSHLTNFREYSAAQRIRDFTEFFGRDFTMLEARINRFINGFPD